MLTNNNLGVCHMLVKRGFRFHPMKNLILALAAMLVAALYSFVFLLGNSVENASLLNYQYRYGSTSHILYTGLTERQADTIAGNANIKSTVRLSTIGQLSDPVIGQRQVKLAVTDRAYAETVLSIPSEGRLPEAFGEIALDEFTMDSLGVAHTIGTPVALQWTDPEGNGHIRSFVLCGWWASPTNFTEACAWITADTAQALEAGYDDENAHNVTLGVTLYRPDNLEEQAADILKEQGVGGCSFTTNLAYNDARKEQAERNAMPYYTPAVSVLLCGYLMIYGIVHVAAGRDTVFYAKLKSLGMTPRQIRFLLLEQGCAALLLGMIPGWALGFLLHFHIVGRVVVGMEEHPALYFLSWKPFAAAALCALATVCLAYLLPTLRLAYMTPAQTIRSVSDRIHHRKHMEDGRVTLARMAARVLGYGRWRIAVSAVTLLLAVAQLNSVWIQYISVKEELYMSVLSPWDYSISDGSAYLSIQRYNERNQGITERDVEELRRRPEVISVSTLKSRELELEASPELRRRIAAYYNQPYDETHTLRDTQEGAVEWLAGLDRLEQEGKYIGLVIGLDGEYLNYVLKYSAFTSGSFEEDAFGSGKYVLAAGANYEGISTPAAGEAVELAGETFTIMGSVMNEDSYLAGSNSREAAFCVLYLMPAEAFDRLFPGQCYRQLAVNIDGSRQEAFEAYLDEYEQGLYRGVGITRRSEYQQNFQVARLNMVLPDLIIGVVLFGIAVLNFGNMLILKMVGRKKEFAVYESLGMTRGQLGRLLLLEGGFHALLMAGVIVPLILFFDRFVMPAVVENTGSWTMVYTFSMLPLGLSMAVIAALSVAAPLACLAFVTKGSLNDRLGRIE